MKKIVTVQDISCVGQCSLTVALPVVSAFGVETCILPSAVLSTHTGGFVGFTFRDLTDDFPAIIKHWQKENIKFDGVYTGYIGNGKQIDYILELMTKARKENAPLIVDPAMADFGKLYMGFDMTFVEEMKRLTQKADYVLPNITEASLLLKEEYKPDCKEKSYYEKLLKGMYESGAKNVVLKGVTTENNKIGVATFSGNEINYYLHEKINRNMHGTGDLYASCFVGALMNDFSANDAAKIAANLTLSAIKETVSDKEHWYGVKFEKVIPEIVKVISK